MTSSRVVSVIMPERGVFIVRCPDSVTPEECVCGRKVIVTLDYGEDSGEIVSAAVYDPDVHGPHLPSYRLQRFVCEGDAERFRENSGLSQTLSLEFQKTARCEVEDLRVIDSRLSFGRTRLFVRYVSERRKPDLSNAFNAMKRLHKVSVNAWQVGPRDEVACIGALGPCGRVCCCASWQKRFPSRITPPADMNPASLNGVCGRFKCCWSFE